MYTKYDGGKYDDEIYQKLEKYYLEHLDADEIIIFTSEIIGNLDGLMDRKDYNFDRYEFIGKHNALILLAHNYTKIQEAMYDGNIFLSRKIVEIITEEYEKGVVQEFSQSQIDSIFSQRSEKSHVWLHSYDYYSLLKNKFLWVGIGYSRDKKKAIYSAFISMVLKLIDNEMAIDDETITTIWKDITRRRLLPETLKDLKKTLEDERIVPNDYFRNQQNKNFIAACKQAYLTKQPLFQENIGNIWLQSTGQELPSHRLNTKIRLLKDTIPTLNIITPKELISANSGVMNSLCEEIKIHQKAHNFIDDATILELWKKIAGIDLSPFFLRKQKAILKQKFPKLYFPKSIFDERFEGFIAQMKQLIIECKEVNEALILQHAAAYFSESFSEEDYSFIVHDLKKQLPVFFIKNEINKQTTNAIVTYIKNSAKDFLILNKPLIKTIWQEYTSYNLPDIEYQALLDLLKKHLSDEILFEDSTNPTYLFFETLNTLKNIELTPSKTAIDLIAKITLGENFLANPLLANAYRLAIKNLDSSTEDIFMVLSSELKKLSNSSSAIDKQSILKCLTNSGKSTFSDIQLNWIYFMFTQSVGNKIIFERPDSQALINTINDTTGKIKIKFVNKLPIFNCDNTTILILNEQKNNFHQLWQSFYYYYDCKISDTHQMKDGKPLKENSDFWLKSFLLIDNLIANFDWEDLPKLLAVNSNITPQMYSYFPRRAMQFLLYVIAQGYALACNQLFMKAGPTLTHDLITFLDAHILIATLLEREKKISTNRKGFNKSAAYASQIKSIEIDQYSENDFYEFVEKIIYTNFKEAANVYENYMRLLFHAAGNHLLKTPRKIQKEVRTVEPKSYIESYKDEKKFIYLYESAIRLLSTLESFNQKQTYAKAIKEIFDFLKTNCVEHKIFDKSNLMHIYDPLTEGSFHDWIRNSIAISRQSFIQTTAILLCEYQESLHGAFPTIYRKNYAYKSYTKRQALESQILHQMMDIVLHRPPSSYYYPKKNLPPKYEQWWPHLSKVQPMLPMMVLLHIAMPHRTEHIRTLDIDKFWMERSGEFLGFHISTDKNHNREHTFQIEKEYVEIMFSKETLALIKQYISYANHYFDNIAYVYQDDDPESPWGLIRPLFPDLNGTGFVSKSTYTGYYYKVLIKALLELGKNVNEYITLSTSKNRTIRMYPLHPDDLDIYSESDVKKSFSSEHYGPHAFRMSNITRYIAEGYPVELIVKLSGHEGIDTVLRVYIDYKMLMMTSKYKKIATEKKLQIDLEFPTQISSNMLEQIREWIRPEDPEQLLLSIEEYELVTPPRILNELGTLVNNEFGKEIILQTSPYFWSAKPWGICTSTECPPGTSDRCSACPYLLTNVLFAKGIQLGMLLTTMRITKLANNMADNRFKAKMTSNEYSKHGSLQKDNIIDMIAWQHLSHEVSKDLNSGNDQLQLSFEGFTREDIPINNGLVEIYSLAKDCYFHNHETDLLEEELARKILTYAIQQRRNDLPMVPDAKRIIEWFMPSILENQTEKLLELSANNIN